MAATAAEQDAFSSPSSPAPPSTFVSSKWRTESGGEGFGLVRDEGGDHRDLRVLLGGHPFGDPVGNHRRLRHSNGGSRVKSGSNDGDDDLKAALRPLLRPTTSSSSGGGGDGSPVTATETMKDGELPTGDALLRWERLEQYRRLGACFLWALPQRQPVPPLLLSTPLVVAGLLGVDRFRGGKMGSSATAAEPASGIIAMAEAARATATPTPTSPGATRWNPRPGRRNASAGGAREAAAAAPLAGRRRRSCGTRRRRRACRGSSWRSTRRPSSTTIRRGARPCTASSDSAKASAQLVVVVVTVVVVVVVVVVIARMARKRARARRRTTRTTRTTRRRLSCGGRCGGARVWR